ncbi:hypothetical protein KUTeg_022026 [Tegillarca granosa]|uniref:Uncharacterized protein n=1 Tax=Tegillarca granosa TaxID=220873 RepID=A0ABQ9EAD0_TEGGR|nr:hypothetical protein KUTeg_022026 [Tegillarca granosa]
MKESEREFVARSKHGKRKIVDRTPVKTPRKSKRQMIDIWLSPFSPLKKKRTSSSARKTFEKMVKIQTRKEATTYSNGNHQLSIDVTRLSLEEFSWPLVIKDLRDNMPLLFAALAGAVTTNRNEMSKLRITLDDKFWPSILQLGTAFGILMYSRHPRKFNFLQEMWSSGSSQKLFQSFQHLGISKGIKGGLASVDRLRKEFDSEIKNWKQEIEIQVFVLCEIMSK